MFCLSIENMSTATTPIKAHILNKYSFLISQVENVLLLVDHYSIWKPIFQYWTEAFFSSGCGQSFREWLGGVLVIYGGILDVDVIGQTSLGVQALATIPLKTQKRGIGDLNIPMTFGGVTFLPGEFVYADNNGVIVASQRLEL